MSILDDTEAYYDDNTKAGKTLEEVEEEEELELFASLKKRRNVKKKKKVNNEDGNESITSTNDKKTASWIGTDRDYTYTELLEYIYRQIHEKNPALTKRKKHSMPPPQMARVGSRKTMWSNFANICNIMHRQQSHVQSF